MRLRHDLKPQEFIIIILKEKGEQTISELLRMRNIYLEQTGHTPTTFKYLLRAINTLQTKGSIEYLNIIENESVITESTVVKLSDNYSDIEVPNHIVQNIKKMHKLQEQSNRLMFSVRKWFENKGVDLEDKCLEPMVLLNDIQSNGLYDGAIDQLNELLRKYTE